MCPQMEKGKGGNAYLPAEKPAKFPCSPERRMSEFPKTQCGRNAVLWHLGEGVEGGEDREAREGGCVERDEGTHQPCLLNWNWQM